MTAVTQLAGEASRTDLYNLFSFTSTPEQKLYKH